MSWILVFLADPDQIRAQSSVIRTHSRFPHSLARLSQSTDPLSQASPHRKDRSRSRSRSLSLPNSIARCGKLCCSRSAVWKSATTEMRRQAKCLVEEIALMETQKHGISTSPLLSSHRVKGGGKKRRCRCGSGGNAVWASRSLNVPAVENGVLRNAHNRTNPQQKSCHLSEMLRDDFGKVLVLVLILVLALAPS